MNKLPEGYTKSSYPGIRKTFAGLENKVSKYEWGKEIIPGVTTIATPGHTPGHTSFVVASGSAKLLVQSDVTNIPHLFLRDPTWQVMYDVDPLTAAETRKKILRYGLRREGFDSGLPFSISLGRISARANSLEPDNLSHILWCRGITVFTAAYHTELSPNTRAAAPRCG